MGSVELQLIREKLQAAVARMQNIDTVPDAESLVQDCLELLDSDVERPAP